MNFGDVFSKAWNTVWKNKVLWIFGFFASLLASSGSNNGNGIEWRTNWEYSPGNLPRFFHNFGNSFENFFDNFSRGEWIAFGLGMALVAIVFFLVTMFLGHVGRAAVVRGAALANDESKLKFGPMFKEGLRYFWKLLGLTGLLFAGILAIVIAIVIFSIVTLGIGAIIFACLALPIIIVVALLVIQSTIFIVVEDESVFDAIAHAWKFAIEEHLGNYLLMGLILVVGAIIAGFIIMIPALIIGIPTALALFSANVFSALKITVAIIAFVIYLPLYIVAQGLVTSFIWSSWVYFYQDLIAGDTRNEEELEVLTLEGGMPTDGEML